MFFIFAVGVGYETDCAIKRPTSPLIEGGGGDAGRSAKFREWLRAANQRMMSGLCDRLAGRVHNDFWLPIIY